MSGYKVHPVAAMFPMIEQGSRTWLELLDSISTLGQLDPIVLDGDILIDGRNRLAVCESLGKVPKTIQWADLVTTGFTQAEWIFTKNYDRRSLTDEQRAAVAAEYFNFEEAERKKKSAVFKSDASNPRGQSVRTISCEPSRNHKMEHANSTVGQVAAKAGVSHHKARQAVKLAKAAKTNPEAAQKLAAVKAGKLKLKDAEAPKPIAEKTLRERFDNSWGRFLGQFSAAELPEVKQWIKESL